MKVEDLANLGIEPEYIAAWKESGIDELTEIQRLAFSQPRLNSGRNAIIVAPTSSGKTFVGEVLAVRAASNLHRAIYLVPYKALAEEKFLDFSERYRNLGIPIVVSSGDYSEFDADIRRGSFGLAVIVYEKLVQLLAQSPGIMADCQLLVVDEVQLIREEQRGPLLEMLLTRAMRSIPSPQIVCLSATVQDLGGFDSWLRAERIETKNRPVPLWEGVVDGDDLVLHNVADGKTKSVRLKTSLATEKEAVLTELVELLKPDQQMLVFRTQVDATEQTASRLAKCRPVRPVAAEVTNAIRALEESPLRAFLEKWADRRVGYHNGGLSVEERRLVERLFREGSLQVVVTTTTLAAGVNLPADTVVVSDYRRWNSSKGTRVPISVAEYKNCAGRAGRFGKRSAGAALLLGDTPGMARILEKRFIFGDPPRIDSAIPIQPDLRQHVLRAIAEQLATDRAEAVAFFRDSFAFASFYQPHGTEQEMLEAVESGVDDLVGIGLVEKQDGRLRVTPLGIAAARSGISIRTFGILTDLVRDDVSSSSDEQIFESIVVADEMKRLRPFDPAPKAELLSRWIAGVSVMRLCRDFSGDYSIGYGRIRDLGEVAEWILSTTARIAQMLEFPGEIVGRLVRLAHQSHFGVPGELVELAKLRVLRRSDLLKLARNRKGLKLTEIQQILDANAEVFDGILPADKVALLKERIAGQITEALKRRKTGHLHRCDRLAAIKSIVMRVYESQGVDFEQALEDLLNAPLVGLGVHRFTQQNTGQPDLEFQGSKGTVVMSATASNSDQKLINWSKSREVLGSVGYTGQASNFVTIGKPDFHATAIENAQETAGKDLHLLLAPVDVIVELCLQRIEGKIERSQLVSKLEDSRGYLQRDAS